MRKYTKFNKIIALLSASIISVCSVIVFSTPTVAIAATTLPDPVQVISFDGKYPDNVKPKKRAWGWDDNGLFDLEPGEISSINYTEGVKGKAMDFNKTYGLAINPGFSSEMYTIGYWIKAKALTYATPTVIITPTKFSDEKFVNVTVNQFDISPCVWTHTMTPYDVRYSTGLLSNGLFLLEDWHYLTIAVDGDTETAEGHVTVAFYIDGFKISSGAIPSGLLCEGATIWFGMNIWDELYEGALDEMSIYDVCLTDEQVKELYLSAGGSKDAKDISQGILGYSSFEEQKNWNDWNDNNNDWNNNNNWNDNNNDLNAEPDVDNHGNSTILDAWLDSHSFLHLNVSNIKLDSPYTENEINPFALQNGKPINIYLVSGVLLLLLSLVIILAIIKKSKQKY